jgi:hypothetical protein
MEAAMVFKTGQVCTVIASDKLLDDAAFNEGRGRSLKSYPSVEREDLVIILGGFRARIDRYQFHEEPIETNDRQYFKVLHPKEGVGWLSGNCLKPVTE